MDIQNVLSELQAERNRINLAIAALESLSTGTAPRRGRPPKAKTAAAAPARKQRTMSPAARKRISEAMKKRWAKWQGKTAPKAAKAASKKSTSRPAMSAAARKKLSDMMKKRWAERQKASAS